jgi:hypothetical protein
MIKVYKINPRNIIYPQDSVSKIYPLVLLNYDVGKWQKVKFTLVQAMKAQRGS